MVFNDLSPSENCSNCKISMWHSGLTLSCIKSRHDEFVYLSNSDNSDFEESFRAIQDDTSEIFDPPPSPSSSLGSEMESVEENQTNLNSHEPNSYGLQEIIIPVMPKLNRISMMVGTGLLCKMKRILDLNMGHL